MDSELKGILIMAILMFGSVGAISGYVYSIEVEIEDYCLAKGYDKGHHDSHTPEGDRVVRCCIYNYSTFEYECENHIKDIALKKELKK